MPMQKFYRQHTHMKNLHSKLVIPAVDQEIINFIQPNMATGPWIAGGSVIQWYRGEAVGFHDIDVFFRDEQQFLSLKNKCNTIDRYYMFDSDDDTIENVNNTVDLTPAQLSIMVFNSQFAETYKINNTHTVQLIKSRFYPSVTEILKHFDIVACKLATDGKYCFTNHPNTINHIERYILDMEDLVPESAIKRLLKYWAYGYQPTAELLDRFQNSVLLETNFINSTDYDT